MRRTTCSAVAVLAALALAGCGGRSPSTAAAGGAGPAATSGAPAPATGTTTGSAPDAGSGADGGDLCRYLTVEEVKVALGYTDAMTSGIDNSLGYPECVYQAPDNGFVRVDLWVRQGGSAFDDAKSLHTAKDCVSTGIGDESVDCPQSDPGRVIFVKENQSVNVTVTNVQSIIQQQGTDSTQAAIALAKLSAARL